MSSSNDSQNSGVARLRTLLLEFTDTFTCLPKLRQEVDQWIRTPDVDHLELARGLEPQLIAATEWLMDFNLLPTALQTHPRLVELMERTAESVKFRTIASMVSKYYALKEEIQTQRVAEELAESARIIDGRYEILANGAEIRDLRTGLVWQRCQVGQKWNGTTCIGKAKEFTFDEAEKLAGQDWRLPTKDELLTLVDLSAGRPTINHKAFPNTPAANVWTCSPYTFYSDYSWLVDFNNGYPNGSATYVNGVRLVRTESNPANAISSSNTSSNINTNTNKGKSNG